MNLPQRRPRTWAPKGHEIIYALACPFSGVVTYVGKTSDSLQGRLSNHLLPEKLNTDTNKALSEWKRNLLMQGVKPLAIVLEMPSCFDADEAEKKWTKHFHSVRPLLNIRNIN